MQKIFNNILVPVRLNRETDHTVENAIDFANRLECNLHILYTARSFFISPSIFRFKTRHYVKAEKQRRLAELQNRYCRSLKKGLLLFISSRTGNPEKEAAAYAVSHEIDMLYIMAEENRFPLFRERFNVNRLAGLANCAILTINSHPCLQGFEKIVLPIGQSLPVTRMRVAIYLAQQFNAVIHLVTQQDGMIMQKNLLYLEKAYQLLKDNTDLPLVCSTYSGDHPDKAVINYAYSVNADLILANPATKPSAGGFLSKLFTGSIFRRPRVPVMMVD